MKVIICSLAGNVGKTTITAHMLHPRMPNAQISAVDTANITVKDFGIDCNLYSGEQFNKLYKELIRQPHAIIDVGGSKEGKEFLQGMYGMQGHDEIDAFIVPTLSDDKAQKASYKTIQLLLDQGIRPEKIKVIFNSVEKNTEEEFDYLLGSLTTLGLPFSLKATIFKNSLFNILSNQQLSITDILNDETDYKALIRAADDVQEQEIARWMDLLIAQKSAPKVNAQLDQAFAALFPDIAFSTAEARP